MSEMTEENEQQHHTCDHDEKGSVVRGLVLFLGAQAVLHLTPLVDTDRAAPFTATRRNDDPHRQPQPAEENVKTACRTWLTGRPLTTTARVGFRDSTRVWPLADICIKVWSSMTERSAFE
jgi:hypothetical protein